MRRSPIEKDAAAGLVTAVDKFHKFRGRPVAAGGGEITKGLIAPGAVVRMLHDGKQLDVRVAELLDIRNELIGEFAGSEPAIWVFGDATQGAEMNFVNGNRRLEPVFAGTRGEPVGVIPAIRFQI